MHKALKKGGKSLRTRTFLLLEVGRSEVLPRRELWSYTSGVSFVVFPVKNVITSLQE